MYFQFTELFQFYIISIMSKNKGKDKKQENYEVLQRQYQAQKRELLDSNFTIKKLQQRLNFLTQDNYRLQSQRQNQYNVLSEKIEELTIKNQTNEKRLISMRNDLTNSEVQNKKLTNSLNLLEKNIADQRAEKTKDIEEMKKNHNFEVTKLDNMLADYKFYMNERDARQKQTHQLYQAKQIQIANRIREVADKEREKVQATDKIRDEMGNKIRQMRQNLLSLKKEELQTTTRLTMLQNHQLTSQLEYQSKQTEKIVFKNEELEQTITKLRQELQIHKQIEDQLSKRSHFSKGVIKKLHSRIEQLESEVNNSKNLGQNINPCSSEQSSLSMTKQSGQKQEKTLVLAMEKELQKCQKKFAEVQSRYQGLRREKEDLSLKWQTSQRTKNELFNTLLKRFRAIQDGEQGQQQGKQNETLTLNLGCLKGKDPSNWSAEEIESVVEILLVTSQSYLTTSNLSIPQLRKIVVIGEEKEKQLKAFLPKLATDREKKLFVSASEKKIRLPDDLCSMAKNELGKQKYSINIASKMVTNRLREWGKQVPSKNKNSLNRKYQLSCTYRV